MRTTVTLDDDVARLLEAERSRTGESFREALNRMLRRAAQSGEESPPSLPLIPGRPGIDIADVSAVLGDDDDARDAERHLH